MDFESIRRKNGEAPYKTSPKSDVEPKFLTLILSFLPKTLETIVF